MNKSWNFFTIKSSRCVLIYLFNNFDLLLTLPKKILKWFYLLFPNTFLSFQLCLCQTCSVVMHIKSSLPHIFNQNPLSSSSICSNSASSIKSLLDWLGQFIILSTCFVPFLALSLYYLVYFGLYIYSTALLILWKGVPSRF